MSETKLANLDYSVLQQCMHCGMCLPTCPTYSITKRERNSPRGRIAWMRAIADGELDLDEEFADEMSYCVGCLACTTACPAGVDYVHMLETARTEVEASGVKSTPLRSAIRYFSMRVLFKQPRLLDFVGRILRLYQNSGAQESFRKWGLTTLLSPQMQALEPNTPRMQDKFSDELIEEWEKPSGETRYRVAVLTGCVQSLTFSDVNRATVDVLLENGCAVYTPRLQHCCGSLHAHNGDHDSAVDLAKKQIDAIDPFAFDAIISNAGGCGSHLKHYDRLLSEDTRYAEAAKEWSRKLKDVSEWLVEIGFRKPSGISDPAEKGTLTYHEACHLCHGQKITAQPREILKSLPGFEFTECKNSDRCCGSAGIYSITQPDTANELLRQKLEAVEDTGASVLALGNPGCHLHIENGLKAGDAKTEVVHPVVLLARAYADEKAILPKS
ncbi:(Fe-S)-binding protein [Pelagicoccus albus]|uniref:Glycolate oxidase iron-sulfur subunit n=1 Tax=Pelagicoccus albus TaxID=415222 RepID=A0A7X1E9P2_9BACT|nr:(Fe-S)-binding protein [Pelagicoccus albus]MBC2608075.1 (Fe-S)-binding protein [Pelagicoccus albus]